MNPTLKEIFHNNVKFSEQVRWNKKSYRQGATILHAGDYGNELYLMLGGEAHVNMPIKAAAGRESGLSRLFENDVFGELSLFEERPRTANVIAATDCELAVIEGSSLVAFMDSHPEIGYFILRDIFNQVVDRLRQNNIRTTTVLELYLRECGE